MFKKLLFGVAIAVLLTGGLQAQSGSKGSNSKSSNRGSSSRSQNAGSASKAMAEQVDKMASRIARTEFAGVKLDKTQRGLLKDLTKTNYQEITSLESQIGQLIPERRLSKLKRTYNNEIKVGKSRKDAMVTSMQMIELPEATQEKILMLSDSKTELMNKITMGVKETFTEEQSAMLAEKMAMKEAKMAEKAKMMKEKEMMSEEKTMTSGEASGSGSKTDSGSGSKTDSGSGSK